MICLSEIAARVYENYRGPRGAVSLELALQPYMMFTAHPGQGIDWTNRIKGVPIPIHSTMKFNNYGFAEETDFSFIPDAGYLEKYARKNGEKLILMTGGSAAYGVGATANSKTVPSQVEHYLNAHSEGVRYKVLNLAMGSWIAYQQFIGLSLFGLPLDPDWIVVMDGRNDGVVPCGHGSGAGNPLSWPTMLFLLNQQGSGIPSYINFGLRYSALLRTLTGKQPKEAKGSPSELIKDSTDPDNRFFIKMAGVTIEDEDRQLNFYINAQLNIALLFHQSNIIFSTQPLYSDNLVSSSYRPAFGVFNTDASRNVLKSDLDNYMDANKRTPCSTLKSMEAQSYFMGRSALRLTELIATLQAKEPSRRIIYENAEAALPFDARRQDFFIDDVHLSDAGMARLGAFYGEIILSAERAVPFDYASFVRNIVENPSSN